MRSKLQILLIDAEGLPRDGLHALLNSQEYGEVIGVISGPSIGTVSVPLAPDVVIMDIFTTDQDGPDMITAVRSRWPNARVIVLTFRRDGQIVERALRAGADGYLLKTDNRADLTAAFRSVMEGKRYVSPSVFDRVVSSYVRKISLARPREVDKLSDREREVMLRIARGFRTREIADQLSLSQKTIEKHRSNLMRKLGLRSAAAVAAYAIAHGYLDEGDFPGSKGGRSAP